jgi:hypothetical protein
MTPIVYSAAADWQSIASVAITRSASKYDVVIFDYFMGIDFVSYR